MYASDKGCVEVWTNLVQAILSFDLYMGSWDCIQVARIIWQAHFAHEGTLATMGFVLFIFLKAANRLSLYEPAPYSLLLQQDCKVSIKLNCIH